MTTELRAPMAEDELAASSPSSDQKLLDEASALCWTVVLHLTERALIDRLLPALDRGNSSRTQQRRDFSDRSACMSQNPALQLSRVEK